MPGTILRELNKVRGLVQLVLEPDAPASLWQRLKLLGTTGILLAARAVYIASYRYFLKHSSLRQQVEYEARLSGKTLDEYVKPLVDGLEMLYKLEDETIAAAAAATGVKQ